MNEPATNGKLKWRDVLCIGFKIVALAGIVHFVVNLGRLGVSIAHTIIEYSGSRPFGQYFTHPQYEIRAASVPLLGLVLAVLLLVFARRLARLIVGEGKDVASLADGLRVSASIIGVSIVLAGVPGLLGAILDFMRVGINVASLAGSDLGKLLWDASQRGTYEIIRSSLVICMGIYFAWGANWLVDYVCGVRPEPEASEAQ